MPHADSSELPHTITTRAQLWDHIHEQLVGLLAGQRNWVTNAANTSSLIFNSLRACSFAFGSGESAVNWCGFYVDSACFAKPAFSTPEQSSNSEERRSQLLLGPFCGKPACQFIDTDKGRGVCAGAYLQKNTLVVPDVEQYPGHIACDGETKSELVCPLLLHGRAIGVLDLDCLALSGFEDDDRSGVENIAKLVVDSSDW